MTSLMKFPLRLDPDGDDDGREAARPAADEAPAEPGSESRPAQLVLLDGGQMSERDQLLATLAHAFRAARRRARDLSEREGGLPRSLLEGKAPSVAEQRRYARDRKWAPPGHDGGILEGMGAVYGATAGPLVTALGQSLAAIGPYPLRASIAAGLSLLAANVALLLAHCKFAAIVTDLAAGALAALWIGSGYLLMRLTEARSPARDHEEGS